MKKIMFNNRFGLTKAVLSRWKTNTRRIIEAPSKVKGITTRGFYVHKTPDGVAYEVVARDEDEFEIENAFIYPRYKVGEVVAVAQAYKTITNEFRAHQCIMLSNTAGWKNKIFVCADLMPHHIRITGVRIERLQDISDEDCIREGIRDYSTPSEKRFGFSDFKRETIVTFKTPCEAYAALIDRISGRGTWDSNPWVFVYDFELVD